MQFKYFDKTFTIDEDKMNELIDENNLRDKIKITNFLDDLKQDKLENNLIEEHSKFANVSNTNGKLVFNYGGIENQLRIYVKNEDNIFSVMPIPILKQCMESEELENFVNSIPGYARYIGISFDENSKMPQFSDNPQDNDVHLVRHEINLIEHMNNAVISGSNFTETKEGLEGVKDIFELESNYVYEVDDKATKTIKDYYIKELEKDNIPITKYIENAIDVNMESLKLDGKPEDKKEYILYAAKEQEKIDNYLKDLNFVKDYDNEYSIIIGKYVVYKDDNDVYSYEEIYTSDKLTMNSRVAHQLYMEKTMTDEQIEKDAAKIDDYLEKHIDYPLSLLDDAQEFYKDNKDYLYKFKGLDYYNIDRIATFEDTKEFYEGIMNERKAIADFLKEHNIELNDYDSDGNLCADLNGFIISKEDDYYYKANIYHYSYPDAPYTTYCADVNKLEKLFELNEKYDIPYTFGPVFEDDFMAERKAVKDFLEKHNIKFHEYDTSGNLCADLNGFIISKRSDYHPESNVYYSYPDAPYTRYCADVNKLEKLFELNEKYDIPYTFGPVTAGKWEYNLERALKYKEELENKELANTKEEKQKDDFDLEM